MIGSLRERFPIVDVLMIVGCFFAGLLLSYGLDVLWGGDYAALGLLGTCLITYGLVRSLPQTLRMVVLPRAVAVSLGVLLAFLPIEIFLRNSGEFQVWQPYINRRAILLEGVMPGVEGESYFTTDRYGIRGTPYDEVDASVYRILAIGGSTTEALYLDDTEAWTWLLQEGVSAEGQLVWVGNMGRSGHKVLDHYLVLRAIAPRFELDAVLIMTGVNDLMANLSQPERDPDVLRISDDLTEVNRDALAAFAERPYPLAEWHDGRLASLDLLGHTLWSRIRGRGNRTVWIEDQAGENYIVRRQLWRDAPLVIDTLPENFDQALAVYRANLLDLIAEAGRQGLETILVTQPSVWSAAMPADFEQYLWMGFYGDRAAPSGRYTVETLGEGMGQYNQVMLEVCGQRQIRCIDLAAEMNGRVEWFYDDVHFNEAGSRHVAEVMWRELADLLPPLD